MLRVVRMYLRGSARTLRFHNHTYIVPEIALATRRDIVGILDLQEQNLLGRGGLLSVRLPGAFIEAALDDLPQIVARRDGKIVAYLLAGSRSVHAQTPIIKAMFRAYSGSHDAYIYGPICVAESERGHGLATALFAELRERLPERECVAFVRRDNAASLRAHLKMGMKDVASFEHDGVAHAVLAFAAPGKLSEHLGLPACDREKSRHLEYDAKGP